MKAVEGRILDRLVDDRKLHVWLMCVSQSRSPVSARLEISDSPRAGIADFRVTTCE
jgi:hypothetical protein